MTKTLTIRFDGSIHGNGTPEAYGGYGWHAESDGNPIGEGHRFVPPPATVNVSEWEGLKHALEWANENAPDYRLLLFGDSQLVVFTLSGKWKSKKPHLTKLRDHCRELLRGREWEIRWRPREENTRADQLAALGMGRSNRAVTYPEPDGDDEITLAFRIPIKLHLQLIGEAQERDVSLDELVLDKLGCADESITDRHLRAIARE